MSVINQMLRDLDARGAVPADFSVAQGQVTLNRHRSAARVAMWGGLLLAAVAGGAYLALSGTRDEGMNSAPAGKARLVAEVRASPRDRHTVAVAPPVKPAAASRPTRGGAAVPALPPPVRMMREARSPDAGPPQAAAKPVIPPASVASAATPAEPAVVKKTTEPLPEVEAQQAYDDAQALRRSGKVEAAIGKYQLALERDPRMRNARLQLARVLQENGRPDAALSLLKAGYAQQPDDELAIAVGRLLADQGRRDESLDWLERGRGGLRPPDQALMGALLSQVQRYEEAVRAYQRALAIDPHQGGWLLGMGLALESLGRVDEAQMAYRNALEQGTFKPDVVSFLRQKIRMPAR